MIDVHKLSNNDLGRGVVYHSHGVSESGVLSSWNEQYVFVRFDNDLHGKACRPDDVTFEFKLYKPHTRD